MKIEIVWDEPFLRNFRKWLKRHPALKAKFEEKLTLFTEQPFHPSLKAHSLTGNLKEY